jgi:hypothetical protein
MIVDGESRQSVEHKKLSILKTFKLPKEFNALYKQQQLQKLKELSLEAVGRFLSTDGLFAWRENEEGVFENKSEKFLETNVVLPAAAATREICEQQSRPIVMVADMKG